MKKTKLFKKQKTMKVEINKAHSTRKIKMKMGTLLAGREYDVLNESAHEVVD